MRIYFSNFLFVIGVAIALGALVLSAVTIRTYRSLEVISKDEMMHLNTTGVTLLDREGNEFFTFDAPGRKAIIPYRDIPDHVVQALVAAEDENFFRHRGVSPKGIARAIYLDLKYKTLGFGGSTITQQLVKNLLLNPQKNFLRKYQEAVFALKFERRLSKEDILDVYLNIAYFGEGAYGIEAAAQTYFNKPASQLTVAEASLLIGILPAPTSLSPISGNTAMATRRQMYVLRRMEETGYLSPDQRKQAINESLHLAESRPSVNTAAVHFAFLVREHLLNTFTLEYVVRSGLRVRTTLDRSWQEQAQAAAAEHVASLESRGASNGAVVAIDPASNEVRALVGSRGWNHPGFGKINMAAAPRQTGSAFKPIVYAAGLQQHKLTAATVLRDQPIDFGNGYKPENYNKRYRGRVLARYALSNSLNVPSVDIVSKIGPSSVASFAQRFGITTLSKDAPYNLSIALGSEAVSLLELTNAYTVFADKGWHRPPQLILSIEDKFGKAVPWSVPEKRQVISEEVAFIISSILSDARAQAPTFGRMLVLPFPAAAKTGTTQDYRDAWTVGYTPSLTIGVWIGNSDNRPMEELPGAVGAVPLWKTLMTSYAAATPTQEFSVPSQVAQIRVCPGLGLKATKESGGTLEYFVPGTEPTRYCPAPKSETIGLKIK